MYFVLSFKHSTFSVQQKYIMNIQQALFKEHSKEQAIRIAKCAIESESNMRELMDCFSHGEYRIAQRASYSVLWVVKLNPDTIKPFIREIINLIEKKDVHVAVIRNSIRVLETVYIPEEFHGTVMNACFNYLENPKSPIAVKAFSMTTLFNLAKVYPDILQELKQIIEEGWDNETPAFKSRGKQILKYIECQKQIAKR